MNIALDLGFPHNFTCTVVDELPGRAARRFDFPKNKRAGQDGILIHVRPGTVDAEPWLGMFAFDGSTHRAVTRVLSMPDPDKICVVAKGAGYVVSAATPDSWETVDATPIIDVATIPEAGIVVFANYTELLAYDKSGVKWRTSRLAWDGLKILSIDERALVGEYEAGDEIRRFEVELATGATVGGVEC